MVKIDLITGFLGSGKTTFLIDYAKYLVGCGEKVAVVVNDHGAINVDRLLLEDALKGICHLEMVIGGDSDCRRRRLKTKLIAMGMQGFSRVLLEPSGVFDVDEFFDMLFEEPLDRWYEIGNVLAIVEAGLSRDLSMSGRYLLTSQAAKAGRVILSKGEGVSEEERASLIEYINESLQLFKCTTVLKESRIYNWKLGEISEEDYLMLSESGYRSGEMIKLPVDEEEAFDSLFYFHVRLKDIDGSKPKVVAVKERLNETIRALFEDPDCGNIMRIKGFIKINPDSDVSGWLEVNATKTEVLIRQIPVGQELFIVIGENLDKEHIGSFWDSYMNEV